MSKMFLYLIINVASIIDSTSICQKLDSIYYSFYNCQDSIVAFVSLKNRTNEYQNIAPVSTFDLIEQEKVVALILDADKNFLSLAFTQKLLPGKYDVFCFYNEKLWDSNKAKNFFLLLYSNKNKRFYYFSK
jgi:hypothetical protein